MNSLSTMLREGIHNAFCTESPLSFCFLINYDEVFLILMKCACVCVYIYIQKLFLFNFVMVRIYILRSFNNFVEYLFYT